MKSDCRAIETWGALTPNEKIDAAGNQGTALPAASPGSACAQMMESEGKKFIAIACQNDKAKTKAAAYSMAVILDRCCQSTTGTVAGDATVYSIAKDKNVGFGKARLPGVANTCKGWHSTIGSNYPTGDVACTDKMYTTFYSAVPTGKQAIGGAGTPYATGGAREFTAIWHSKAANLENPSTNTGEITVKATPASPKKAAIDATCGAGQNTNACLVALRNQCKMTGDVYWGAKAGWMLQYPGPIVCGGFCKPSNAVTYKFYTTNFCYLAVTTDKTAGDRCYSSKAPSPTVAQMPQAFNDPKVVNMAGDKFEILQSGTFTMLNVEQEGSSKLNILATIDRAGSRCGATYIQNVTLNGAWVSDLGVPTIHVRAAAALPKKLALQMSTDDENWLQSSQWQSTQNISFTTKLKLMLHSTEVEVSVDSHRIVEGERKTRRFANFLNLNVKGVHQISGIITGLLGSDNHDDAAKVPEDCTQTDFNLKSKILSVAAIQQLGDEDEVEGAELEGEGEGSESCALEDCGAEVFDEK